jgi:quercetin dioxygenase-like cupin family protein
MSKPYTQKTSSDKFYRIFLESVDPDTLVWHRDANTRHVKTLEGQGWKLQLDNNLPVELVIGETYLVPKEEWHRLIKGKGNLKVEITEL